MTRGVLLFVAFFFSASALAVWHPPVYYYFETNSQAMDFCRSLPFRSNNHCVQNNSSQYQRIISTHMTGRPWQPNYLFGGTNEPECDNEDRQCTTTYIYYGTSSCPSGTEPDSSGQCLAPEPEACQLGSLSPSHCAVQCPATEYTYYLDGVLRHGRTAAGSVGHGQSCPTPIYPSGSQEACIGDVGTCETYGSIDERIPVTVIEETVTQNPDGSTTTEKTTRESGGNDSSNTGGGGSNVLTAGGIPIDPMTDYKDTVNIGAATYARCEHGGLVDSTIMCDYVPPQCPAGQFPSATGCIDAPKPENPHYAPPQTITKTNPDGSSTTIIHEGSTTVNQGGGQPGQGEGKASTGSASGTCSAPPQSTGDAQLNAILRQQWEMMCLGDLEAPEFLPDSTGMREQLETELSDKFNQIKAEIGQYFDFSPPSGACTPNNEQIYGVNIDFSVCRFIGLYQAIGTLLVALAALSAVAIITRSKK